MQIGIPSISGTCRRGPACGIPTLFGQAVLLLASTLLLMCVFGTGPALAEDELRLIGIVKTIDPKTGIVFVDVQSESCPGIRRFYTDDLAMLRRYLNETIIFYIDSATCRDTGIHTIVVSRGIKK